MPEDSRAVRDGRYLKEDQVSQKIEKVRKLNVIAEARGQSMAQMAIAWLLKDERVTSVLVGVSRERQLVDNVNSLKRLDFSEDELTQIEAILKG